MGWKDYFRGMLDADPLVNRKVAEDEAARYRGRPDPGEVTGPAKVAADVQKSMFAQSTLEGHRIPPNTLVEMQRRLSAQMARQLDADAYRMLQQTAPQHLQNQLGNMSAAQKAQALPPRPNYDVTDANVYGLGGYKAGAVRTVHMHSDKDCRWPRCSCFRLPVCADPEAHAEGCECLGPLGEGW